MKKSHPQENPWVTPISSYLREHPNAFADAEAVARWWVNAPISQWGRVHEALEFLVRKGQLERQTAADGRERYRLLAPAGETPDS